MPRQEAKIRTIEEKLLTFLTQRKTLKVHLCYHHPFMFKLICWTMDQSKKNWGTLLSKHINCNCSLVSRPRGCQSSECQIRLAAVYLATVINRFTSNHGQHWHGQWKQATKVKVNCLFWVYMKTTKSPSILQSCDHVCIYMSIM